MRKSRRPPCQSSVLRCVNARDLKAGETTPIRFAIVMKRSVRSEVNRWTGNDRNGHPSHDVPVRRFSHRSNLALEPDSSSVRRMVLGQANRLPATHSAILEKRRALAAFSPASPNSLDNRELGVVRRSNSSAGRAGDLVEPREILLQTRRQDGLKLRVLFVARDDCDFDFTETGLFKQ